MLGEPITPSFCIAAFRSAEPVAGLRHVGDILENDHFIRIVGASEHPPIRDAGRHAALQFRHSQVRILAPLRVYENRRHFRYVEDGGPDAAVSSRACPRPPMRWPGLFIKDAAAFTSNVPSLFAELREALLTERIARVSGRIHRIGQTRKCYLRGA
jgi:hypothetical protein